MQGPGSPAARLKAKALASIAQREHSRMELRAKLIAFLGRQRRAAAAAGIAPGTPGEPDDELGDGAAQVDALLDWLVERDLLSAERFVEGRVRARASRFGQRRVQQELARHGVALDAQAERDLRQSEPARAQALWARRYGALATEPAQRARQMRFLLARGFDPDVVRRVVAGTLAQHDDGTA